MSQVLVTESYISDIASAIRSKNGQSASYYPSQMAAAIGSIVSAGDLSIISMLFSANGTFLPATYSADAFSGIVVDVANTYTAEDEGKVVSGSSLVVQGSMSISANSIYDTTLISQVSVSIPDAILISKTISENGTYYATSDSADGFSNVTVNVSGSGGDGLPLGIITNDSFSLYNSTLTSLRSFAFTYTGLTEVEMPMLQTIPSVTFSACESLISASFQNCISAYGSAFRGCKSLETVTFPNIENVGYATFSNCIRLQRIHFPHCKQIGQYAFCSCSCLSEAIFELYMTIQNSAFQNCSSLMKLVLLSTSICSLVNIGAFTNTPISKSTYTGTFGSIYVLSSMVSAYQSASHWSYYADRITSYVEE